MMTQLQAIAQSEFKQYVQWQVIVIAPKSVAKYCVQSMTTNFVSGADNQSTLVPSQTDFQTVPNREPLKHLLIGSAKAVTSTIHYLKVIGYADVDDWSQLLPTGNPGEVMSILSRHILVK